MSRASVAVARWGTRIAPGLTARLLAPRVRGTTMTSDGHGVNVASDSGAPTSIIVVFSANPAAMRWLAGSLAKRLSAVVVIPNSLDTPPESIERARTDHGRDCAVTVIGEDRGARAALEASRANEVRRVALVNPRSVGTVDTSRIPTTFIQGSVSSDHRDDTVTLERTLRSAGVGVRETGYSTVGEGWARFPAITAGTSRALDDLVAFLERGIGPAATFDVIPGWDLH